MTAMPLLQVPEKSLEETKSPPASLVNWAGGILTWLLLWPIIFATLLAPAPSTYKIVHWLTVSGFTIWIVSLPVFYAILSWLAEYWIGLKIALSCFEFFFEVLSSLPLS